jgi:hypothetical protein
LYGLWKHWYEGREILKAASTPDQDDVPMTGLGHATMNGGENIPSVNGIGHTTALVHDGMEID